MPRKSDAMEIISKAIGEKIKEARIMAGMSRMTLAAKIGVTHQQLSKYESAENRISVSRLIVLAAACELPVAYFLGAPQITEVNKRLNLEMYKLFVKLGRKQQMSLLTYLRTFSEAARG